MIIQSGNQEQATYAMLDCAATSSAVLSDILDSINGIILERSCKLSTFDKCENSMRNFADFKIQPLDRSFTLDVGNALVGDILTTERDKAPRNLDIKDLSYMKDVSFDELDDPTIGVILDACFAWTWTGLGQRFGSREQPIALRTKFGWTLVGPALDKSDSCLEAGICLLDAQEVTL